MTRLRALSFLPAAILLAACPPDLGLPPDDDDATDDDDDDDDDATDDDDAADDDDATEDLCALRGGASLGFDASSGSPEGTRLEGQIGFDGESVTVIPELGPAFALPLWSDGVDLAALFAGIEGQGSLTVYSTDWGAWVANGVAVVETDFGVVLIGSSSDTPRGGIRTVLGGVTVEARIGTCTEPRFDVDGCGEGAAMPVRFGSPESAENTDLWPGQSGRNPVGALSVYDAWEVFQVLCDDFDSPGYSWSVRGDFTIDGGNPPG